MCKQFVSKSDCGEQPRNRSGPADSVVPCAAMPPSDPSSWFSSWDRSRQIHAGPLRTAHQQVADSRAAHHCTGRGRGDGNPSLAPDSHRTRSLSEVRTRTAVRSVRIWSTPTYAAVATQDPRPTTGTNESMTVGVSQLAAVRQLAPRATANAAPVTGSATHNPTINAHARLAAWSRTSCGRDNCELLSCMGRR